MTRMDLRQTDIFEAGKEGYHTFRIPALIVSNKGTILAFCEGRKNSMNDDGDIDLVLRRSLDNGLTWEPMQLVWDDGENTIGNPCPVVDRETGVIWLPFCRNNDRVFVTSSADDGVTWATPVEITKDVKPAGWRWYATGPTHGIQLRSGRLLIPCDHSPESPPSGPRQYSHVIYSDDHGKSWRLGGVLPKGSDECVAVELADGSIYLNMRSYHGRNLRLRAWSRDGGLSWSEPEDDPALVEPVCQASAVRYSDEQHHGTNRVLFSNPASVKREKMTVRVSYDECRTWRVAKELNPGPSAYSDLAVMPDRTIGCLYERGTNHAYERITFAQFGLEWLTGEEL